MLRLKNWWASLIRKKYATIKVDLAGSTRVYRDVWHYVSTPIDPSETLPAERKTVLVWLKEKHLPFCGYIRYSAGEKDCPYFVVYHENGANVVAWCDCLPVKGPESETAKMYSAQQATGRGYPARTAANIANRVYDSLHTEC